MKAIDVNEIDSLINTPISIDSCKLKIPIRDVKITDSTLNGNVKEITLDELTGEVLEEEFKQKAKPFYQQGIKIKALIVSERTFSYHETFLVILVNSKALKQDYFQGITSQTLPTLLAYLNSLSFAELNIEHLLKAQVVDCDFKQDVTVGKDEMQALFKYFESCVKPNSKLQQGVELQDNKQNHAFQLNRRATKNYIGKPFCKIYNKQLELTYSKDSAEFSDYFLTPEQYQDKYRFEFTLKNRKHFKAYGVESNSLGDLLALNQDALQALRNKCFNANLNLTPNKRVGSTDSVSPMIQVMINAITTLSGSLSMQEIRFLFTQNHISRTSLNYSRKFDEALIVWQAENPSDASYLKAKENILVNRILESILK